MNNNFAIFILTNGRHDRVYTYNALRKNGYTGKIYLLVDDEDKDLKGYQKLYKNEVVIFSKQDAINMTDNVDNFNKRNSVVYARNYSFKIAEDLKIKYFLQLDDDYTTFDFAFYNKKYVAHKKILNLDKTIDIMLEFYKNTNVKSIAFAQGGDFIGGENSGLSKTYLKGELSRKVMNSFFCSTERPFKFMGRINEDVNLYVSEGVKGGLFFTIAQIRLEQKATQSNTGGLTDIYLDLGTYVKSFYSVICAPSCVKLMSMGVKHKRIHHKIYWKNASPCILSEEHKKR